MRIASSSTKKRRRTTTLTVVLLLACMSIGVLASGVASVAADQFFTALDAARSLQAVDPSAVGAGPASANESAPEVTPASDGFEVEDSAIKTTIPAVASEPVSLETKSGVLNVTPVGVSTGASTGRAINDGGAVVYAGTGNDSDTSVVPTEEGIETFTSIRSEDARENYSTRVDLPGDERVEQVDDHTVVIVDPTPADKPSDAQLPSPATPGTPSGAEARGTSGISTPDPDPQQAQAAMADIEQAGTEKPAGVSASQIVPSSPSQEDVQTLAGQRPAGAPAGEPKQHEVTRPDLAAEERKTDAVARDVALADLQGAQQRARESTQHMNATNEETTESPAVVVAKVSAPASVDADGNKVDTTLSVQGDAITMHVDHKGEDVSYPIAADPVYAIVVTGWTIDWFPELALETYVSHWALGWRYIGDWHPIYCAWGWVTSCSSTGVAAWYNGYAGGSLHTAYWPAYNWGPVWQAYWYPVYATRWVVARWVPYWKPTLGVLSIIEEGGEDVTEDDGDSNAGPLYARAAFDGIPADGGVPGKMRGCTTVRRKYKLDASALPDGGRMEYKIGWCWSRYAKDTKYTERSHSLIPRLNTAWEAIAGLDIVKYDLDLTPYTWMDGRALEMKSPFDARACLPKTGLCATLARFEIVRRARWNGSHYGEMRNR